MSLIGEALRKARAEAARREAERDGVPIPPTIVGATRRPRGAFGPPAVAAIALATALGGAGLAWVLARGDRPSTPPTTRAAETPPAAQPPVAAHTGAPQPLPEVPPAATVATRLPAVREVAPLVPPAQEPAAPRGAEAGSPNQAAAPEKTLPAPAGPAQRTEPSGERSFVLRAELGYATLELDYLVYRPGSPFGRVNGQDIVVGSTVAGFTVEEIGRDFIRLRDERGPLVLKVR